MSAPLTILKKYWGYTAFRPLQEEIIRSVLNRQDTLALMPTGGGKSVCFQVPALLTEGICLVVTPLISLMKDQVERLKKQGVPALSVHSGMPYAEVEKSLRNAAEGAFKFLYLSPERIQTSLFERYVAELPVNLITVDEAHCISQWGYDFRPAYLQISALRKAHPETPVLALTATATRMVRADICEKLALRSPAVLARSFVRENIAYSVCAEESKINKTMAVLKAETGCAIVFCGTRRRTAAVAGRLREAGLPAEFYHAGLGSEERARKQEDWMQGRVRIMCCTNAFGMGLDKADVRTVIHYDAPDSLEAYYQETGRAGRDGLPSAAILLYRPSDITELQRRPEIKYPPMAVIRKVYAAMVNFLQLPAGTGGGRYFDFDVMEFSRRFSVPLLLAYNTLKILEQEGILALSENIFLPSRVCFTAGRASLQQFERDYPALAPLVKGLLRTYEGILDNPVPVSERQLGRLLRRRPAQIEGELQRLQAYGLLDYEPCKDSPQLFFPYDRAAAADLQLDMKRILEKKKSYAARIQSVCDYIQDNSVCRSRQLVIYFDEHTAPDCGICDVCRARQRAGAPSPRFEEAWPAIRAQLSRRPLSPGQLEESLPEYPAARIQEILRFLQDEGRIIPDEEGRLHVG
ncbi:ATP-dependent DNA helicase RecQ [Compostibacter hankyongensis]|uniref:RecQ family ATP-dependent DNA helicase n=1 Tax=Compostibacter hankyongensis TaxID=1007089 RepID=UPI0031E7F227